MTLDVFMPIFVAFIVIFISVMVSAAVKSEKKKKNGQSAGSQNVRPRLDDAESDPFEDVVNKDARSTASVRKYVAPVHTVEGTDLVENRPKVHTSAEVVGVARSHHDDHCDVDSHEEEDLYIVEKVPVSGSIGGKSDEGCREHYNLRFVKIEEEEQSGVKFELTHEAIRRAIILGEVINDPAYKK